MSDYHPTLQYLFNLSRFGIKTSLENIRKLCSQLGNPQDEYPIIHIAGTNGKGTTAALIQSILSHAGYKCGLYTSPHLKRFGERIRVGDEMLSDEGAVEMIEELRPNFDRVESTFFESSTAMAFLHFARRKVDIAVVEVGLGGSWDATNIVKPILAVFTPISYDHTDRLGHSLTEIASDKAGIIKPGAQVVSSKQLKHVADILKHRVKSNNCSFHYAPQVFPIIDGISDYQGSKVIFMLIPQNDFRCRGVIYYAPTIKTCEKRHRYKTPYSEYESEFVLSVPGEHQWINLQTALTSVLVLREKGFNLPDTILKQAVAETRWKGRLQIINEKPLVYFDVAHNPAAAEVVSTFFQQHFPGKKIRILMGIVNDKDVNGVLKSLNRIASDYTFVQLPTTRSWEPELLAAEAQGMGCPWRIIKNPKSALNTILNDSKMDDIILAVGSHYLGELIP